MYVPEGMIESDVVDTIKRVSKWLSKKYRFGYYSDEDIEQQVFIIIIENKLLEKYDPSRPLENYLARVLKNRLFNFKRDNYKRPDPPCVRCPLNAFIAPDTCTAYKEKEECTFYSRWINNNDSKERIMNTIPIDNVCYDRESLMSYSIDFEGDIDMDSIDSVLMNTLDHKHRKLYILHKNGEKLKSSDFSSLLSKIKELMDEGLIDG